MFPTVGRVAQAIAVMTAEPDDLAATDEACAPASARAQHTVDAQVDYAARTVAVAQHIELPAFDAAVNMIALDVEPNRLPGAFTLEGVRIGDTLAAYELTGRRLIITLAAPLEPRCALALDLAYRLQVPEVGTDGISAAWGYFGHTDEQFNLGHWLASLAVRRAGDWVMHDAARVGEQTVAEAADWRVTLTASNAPPGLTAAAPGVVEASEATSWTWQLDGARDFAISLSDRFDVRTRAVTIPAADGAARTVDVEVYALPDAIVQTDGETFDGAAHALDVASDSLTTFSALFGAYPHDRYLVVEGDFADGMEFSGMVFVGGSWFRTFAGTPESYLTIITAHETAHQWWYAWVGSDQALAPYLDEALATYSEFLYYSEYHPGLRDWWWAYRVDAYLPQGFGNRPVDSAVYAFESGREYINAVYLRGAHLLHDLREAMGTEAFAAWLRRYAEAGADRVVEPGLLWSLLTPDEAAQTEAIRREYLGALS